MNWVNKISKLICEAVKNLLELIGCLCLIVLAAALFLVITPFALCWKIYVSIFTENRKAREIMSGTAQFFKAIAISIDKFGNVAFGGLFNWLFLKNNVHSFGNTHETISEVLGWAFKIKDLNSKGLCLYFLLNMIEKDHCENARIIGVQKAKIKIALYESLIPIK
ncbi:MAG TPA: hypothetical protein VFM70_05905 [Salinimicrobium sp.]|nr:hypothetical protein [Salinimicrobium sp.]